MSMRVTMMLVMIAFESLGDEHGSKVGKDIGLYRQGFRSIFSLPRKI